MINRACAHGHHASFPLLVVVSSQSFNGLSQCGSDDIDPHLNLSELEISAARHLRLDELPRPSPSRGGVSDWRVLCIRSTNETVSQIVDSLASSQLAEALHWLAQKTPPSSIVCEQTFVDVMD